MDAGRRIIEKHVIEEFRKLDCTCVGDVLVGLGLNCLADGIFPLDPSMRICGPAVTMRQIAARDRQDWARHEKVLVEMCRPGDVLVQDLGGRMDGSPWGGNITLEARTRGLDGSVIDGAIRDSAEIVETGYPVFARGRTLGHVHGMLHSVCLNNEPIQIGILPRAVLVAPGDLVLGNNDGIVIVPAERAKEVLELAKRRQENDNRAHELFLSGKVRGDPEIDALALIPPMNP